MKYVLLFSMLTATLALAAGWDDRVDYYVGSHVSSKLYSIDGDTKTITQWDTASIGKPQPTIAQLTNATDATVDAWIAAHNISIRKTPEWIDFTNSLQSASATLNLYSITALTNSISQVTDTKTKSALNDAKNAIKQSHDEAQAILEALKKWRVVAGKNLQVEP